MEHNTCVVCGGTINANTINNPASIKVRGDKWQGFTLEVKDVDSANTYNEYQTEYSCRDCGLLYKHLPHVKGNYNE